MSRLLWTVAVLIWLGAAACGRAGSTPTEGVPTASSSTPTATVQAANTSTTPPPPTPAPTATLTPAPTPTPEPECPLPNPPPTPVPPDASITAEVAGIVQLDASDLFGSSTTGEWRQQFMEDKSLSYMSNWEVELGDATTGRASFTPEHPGVYRFRYGESGPVVDVEVHGSVASQLQVRGIAFADLFGQIGGPEYDLDPVETVCQDSVFEHGYSVAGRINANWVQFTPASFMQELAPYPIYRIQANAQSLTDDDYYAELLAAAAANGLHISHAEQDAPGIDMPAGEWERRDEERVRSDWWDAWFDYWQSFSVEMATRAAANGAEMYVPFVWADDTFRDPNYEQHWRDLVAAVREVFPGKVAVAITNWGTGSKLSFADALDVLIVGVDGSYYPVAQVGEMGLVMQNRDDPTLAELAIINDDLMARAHATAGDGLPVYFMFAATSSNGQRGSEIQGERDTFITDFAEQVMYYESFFAAIGQQPWVEGVIVGSMDWFDQYERPADEWYFDATNESSPRSKPAEQVLRAWWTPTE